MKFHRSSIGTTRPCKKSRLCWLLVATGVFWMSTFATTVQAQHDASRRIRIATYNVSMYGKKAGEIANRLSDSDDDHARQIAAVIQTARPDILLVNEIDYDDMGTVARLFNANYLAKPQGQAKPIDYPFIYAAPSNTGVDSTLDLNKNGKMGEPNDAWGYGVYPGQYAMAIFSRFPIDNDHVRTFQKFLWKDLPGALRPSYPESGDSYFSDETWKQLRLSSKNHIDVPIQVGGFEIHVLASHPTPPVFDGKEDRNGCRNHDEIKFWSEYLNGKKASLTDDAGRVGGLAVRKSFVIMGDLNADSIDGDGRREAITNLIGHERVNDVQPKSKGAIAESKGKKRSMKQKGDPAMDTAGFGGNLRVDYVLPSANLNVVDSGVVWPHKGSPLYEAVRTTDHRMVWIDVQLP